jgi:hypothetical protein
MFAWKAVRQPGMVDVRRLIAGRNTPHWFKEINSPQIVYLVVRVDPHMVLPACYGAKGQEN